MNLRSIRKISTTQAVLDDGTRIYAYAGSQPDDGSGGADGGDAGGDDAGGDPVGDDDGDGEDGEDGLTKALDAERKRAERNRKALTPWRELSREFGMKPDEIREALRGRTSGGNDGQGEPKSDAKQEVNVEEIKRQAIREANARVNEKLVRSAVTVQAAELLRDPSDAARYIDISDYEVDDDGNVDARQIQDDLKALLRDKPYLGKARKGDGQNGGNPNFDGGTRSGTTALSMDDLIRRTAGARR